MRGGGSRGKEDRSSVGQPESWRAKDKRGVEDIAMGRGGEMVCWWWVELEDLEAGSISIRDLSWYQTGAISDKKSTWNRL